MTPVTTGTSPSASELDRLIIGVEGALTDVVRSVVASERSRQSRPALVVRQRGVFEMPTIQSVSRLSAHSEAHMRLYDSGGLEGLVAIAAPSPGLRTAISGRDDVPDDHIPTFLAEHVAELAERYFEERPTQRGVSRNLLARLIAGYRGYLTSTTSEVTAIIPLSGLEGTVRRVALDGALTLRHLTTQELQALYARHGDEHALSGWFDRDSLSWTYCLAAVIRSETRGRPSLAGASEGRSAALTAIRMITDGRAGTPIAWVRPSASTLIGTSDHIVNLGDRFGRPRSVAIDRKSGRQIARLYTRLRAAPTTVPFRIALAKYNAAVEREWYLDQLIDSWVGLDALFAPDKASSYRMCLRAARFLGASLDERRRIFDSLRRSYKARNEVVHGGPAPADIGDLAEATKESLKRSILGWLDPTRNHDHPTLDAAALE